jgi:cell division protein FtsQ
MQPLNGQTRDQGVSIGKARIARGPGATSFSAQTAQSDPAGRAALAGHAAPEAPLQKTSAPSQTKRDPAPSRMAYRFHRLWLTPGFRLSLRAGLPAVLTFAAVAFYFGQDNNRQDFIDRAAEIRRSVEERPEFMVKLMAVDGASDELSADIREVLPLDFPISSFDLDLGAMKDAIQELIAGEGAENNVAQALRLLATASPIEQRIRGLVRMGERRWDIVLDNDQRILLPQDNPVQALQQVIALDQAQELLSRDVIAIDMRNIHRPTLRMAPMATEELRRIKDIELGAQNDE